MGKKRLRSYWRKTGPSPARTVPERSAYVTSEDAYEQARRDPEGFWAGVAPELDFRLKGVEASYGRRKKRRA